MLKITLRIRLLRSKCLKNSVYNNIDIVANGHEVITALNSISYDLVFMDCHMPEMDGFETTRLIRSNKSSVLNPKIPIVAMTALAMKGDKELVLEAGMDDYLSKPVESFTLAEMLEKWLAKDALPEQEIPASDIVKNHTNMTSEITLSETTAIIFNKTSFLRRLMGNEDSIRKIGKIFLEDMPLQLKELQSAVKGENCQAAGKQAHKIAGAVANVSGRNNAKHRITNGNCRERR